MDPGSPPPPYSGNKPHVVAVPYPPPHPFNGSHSAGPFAPQRSPYGPTPLGLSPDEGVGILPYYNPVALRTEELYSEATRRARWRFIGALFWALVIYSLVAGTSVSIVESSVLREQ